MTTSTQVTEKQVTFIKKLLAERQGVPAAEAIRERANAVPVGHLTKTHASGIIESLLAIPASRPAGQAVRQITVEPGYYFHDDTVFKVQKAKSSGRVYALRYEGATGRYDYAPGTVYDLEPDMELTLEEAKALGNLWDRCCICGTSLSATDSVAAGIGPVCAKRIQSRKAVAAA